MTTNSPVLPAHSYLTIDQASSILKCSCEDIIHWGAISAINIHVYVINEYLDSELIEAVEHQELVKLLSHPKSPAEIYTFQRPSLEEPIAYISGLIPLTADTITYYEVFDEWPELIEAYIPYPEFSLFDPLHLPPEEYTIDTTGLRLREIIKISKQPKKLFLTRKTLDYLIQLKEPPTPSKVINLQTNNTNRRNDGLGRVIAALACSYLGSTENISSKAGEILKSLQECQDRGGMEGITLPSEKTLRGYLKIAGETIERKLPKTER